MPPKKRSVPSTAPAPKARVSKLAKENNLSSAQETEIASAYALFSLPAPSSLGLDTKHHVLRTPDVRRVLIALNTPPSTPSEMQEIVETLDPTRSGYVEYESFVAVAALKLHQQGEVDEEGMREEVDEAFRLFTRGEGERITLAHLKRIARELREDVSDATLRDMVREATGGKVEGGVNLEDFEGVMKRAGVFG